MMMMMMKLPHKEYAVDIIRGRDEFVVNGIPLEVPNLIARGHGRLPAEPPPVTRVSR
jgi:hypothetical protein